MGCQEQLSYNKMEQKAYSSGDEEFNNALMEQDIDTELCTQTPNSPDVNLLDLAFLEPLELQ